MIILLQSVTIQFRRLFWHTSYYKVRQSNFITKSDRLYYKVRQVLQSVKIMIKWDVTEDSEGKSYSVCFFTTKREINCCKFT